MNRVPHRHHRATGGRVASRRSHPTVAAGTAPRHHGGASGGRRWVAGGFALAAMITAVGAGIGAHAPVASAATAPTVAMTVGSAAYRDTSGQVWSAQSGFTGGQLSSPAPAGTVTRGASDPALYKAGRWKMTAWRATVPNGVYNVTLKMTDTWFTKPGMRVFNVSAQGQTVLSNVDIAKNVGEYAQYDRTFTATVKNGVLTLGWQPIVNWPTISAIAVTRVSAAAPPVSSTGPSASTTGVPAGTKLTRKDGTVMLTTPGGVYSGLDIYGRVRVMAPNVTLKNSIVRGDTSSVLGSLVDANYPGANHTNFTLMDSELVPQKPSYYQDGILGHDYTVIRVNIHGTVDAVKIVGNNVTVKDSWLHDTYYSNTPSGPTHNDGVQVLVGHNLLIQGNRIERNNNSGMQVTQDAGAVSGLSFVNNWADGGGCTVNLATKPLPSMSGITVSNNRFYHDTRVANCAIVSGPKTALTATGNVWADTNKPVAITRGA